MSSAGRLLSLALVVACASVPMDLRAQTAVLDDGTFTLFIGGSEAGTETFRIQRSGTGDDARILATATVSIERADGVQEMVPRIETAPDLSPVMFSNKISGARVAQVNGVAEAGRFVTRVTSDEGEAQREFRAGSGTVLLERDVAYLYYFVSRLAEQAGSTLTAIVPSSGDQTRLRVASSEVEPFRFGREQLEVRHIRLEGGGEVHELWLDDQGRVLRVEIPSRNYRAERVPA